MKCEIWSKFSFEAILGYAKSERDGERERERRMSVPCFALRELQIYTCLKHASLQIVMLIIIIIVIFVIVFFVIVYDTVIIFIAAVVIFTTVILYLISGQMFMQLYVEVQTCTDENFTVCQKNILPPLTSQDPVPTYV